MSSPSPLYRDDFLRLLEEVDGRLPEGQVIPITIVGGAAITIIWDDRGSYDVDYMSRLFPEDVHLAAEAVALKRGLPRGWMNHAVQEVPLPQIPQEETKVFEGNRMHVYVPGPDFLLAMKLLAARPRDFNDALLLMEARGLKTPEQLRDLMGRAYPSRSPTEQQEAFIARLVSR